MADKKLRDLWDKVRRKRFDMQDFLTEVHLEGAGDRPVGVRGVRDLRAKFNYPVSVIVGKNGSGKSTVLFAAACAYKAPGADREGFVPSEFFPDYQPKQGTRGDQGVETVLHYGYSTPDGLRSMMWKRSTRSWNRRFSSHLKASQPERQVFLRTLGNLTNPSGRGMSRMNAEPRESPLTVSQIKFTEGLLPFNYSEVIDLSGNSKENLLVATQKNGVAYSELHMATGERGILRLSQDIADAQGALVLIDEVEAALHPLAQKVLMQKFQQLALRNNLQIIVTTHSPVVLNSVPEEGRIFLERNETGEASMTPQPYSGLIQDMLYEHQDKKFRLLCEDDAAQGVLNGVFDIIIPRLLADRGSIRIDCDTGANEFPMYTRVLKRLDQCEDVFFILDGDKRDSDVKEDIISALGGDKKDRSDKEKQQDRDKYQGRVMFLPGKGAPEEWVWSRLRTCPGDFTGKLGMNLADLVEQIRYLDADHDSVSSKASESAKTKLWALSEISVYSVPNICRIVSCRETELWETEREESDIQPLVEYLEAAFREWRET